MEKVQNDVLSGSDSESRLPSDLERLIFETTAQMFPEEIPNLLLTAWRVKAWLEPLLYRVVLVSSEVRDSFRTIPVDTFVNLIKSKPSGFFEKAVRHLMFCPGEVSPTNLDLVLAACSRVMNLFLLVDIITPAELAASNQLRSLTRLALRIDTLHIADLRSPFLQHVTHLELLDVEFERHIDLPASLGAVPRLTHLSINFGLGDADLYARIRNMTQLKCIVFIGSGQAAIDEMHLSAENELDARLVCLFQTDFHKDWYQGATIGDDYWAFADEFIAAKRNGKIDRSRYIISDNDTSWRASNKLSFSA
ncbi:hypothetical protein R3P38DRAFT_2906423 [Favolaschia claudopus]|uniref:Uncharacterized protein n=1 Tax=Favolaschia claudopus TaxID=2862362 RepID=A0AAW0CIC9_9AGAR